MQLQTTINGTKTQEKGMNTEIFSRQTFQHFSTNIPFVVQKLVNKIAT